jgi:hypothetical protein
MLDLENVRWSTLTGGYRTPLDPRPILMRLETEPDSTQVWEELWDELHHQGDIGDASFASVPILVRIHRERGAADWNTYAIVAVIELARKKGENPDVPRWLEEDYFRAIRELAEMGTAEVLRAESPEDVRAILSVIAIEKGLRTHGWFLVNYSEEELLEIEARG